MPIFRKDGRNVLFIHVPKCGGSTIERVFASAGYQTLYLDGRVGRDSANYVRRCTPQHMHAAMLRQTFRLHRFDVVFAIVRDPLARFRSEYLWRNRDREIDLSGAAVEAWAARAFRAFEDDSYAFDNHLRPQVDFMVEGTSVHRFEDGLDTAVADLNERFGLGLDPAVPRVRTAHGSTGHSSGDVVVSDALRHSVMQFYRRDYERFGYGDVQVPLRSRVGATRTVRALNRAYRAFRTPS